MAQKKNLPTKKDSTSVARFNYGEHEGAGFEQQTREDLAIPFITVLQALSPQLETIAAAKPGMLFNTVTEELVRELLFVPATTQHVFVEWVPRDAGGGFVSVHSLGAPSIQQAKESATEFGHYRLPNGNELIETFYLYGVIANEEEPTGLAVIAFTATKIKVYKRLNTRLNTFMLKQPDGRKIRPPLYAHLLRVTSVVEENKKGKFHNFSIVPASDGNILESLLSPEDPRFQAAAECKNLVDSGVARVAYETAQAQEGEERSGTLPF